MSTLRAGPHARYTPEEDALILRRYSREPIVAIAKRLHRSEATLRRHIDRLIRDGRLDRSKRHYNRDWTHAEDELIREHRGEWTDAQIARTLRRTPAAVRERASKLRVGCRETFLTANQVGAILAIDSHKVARLAAMGILPARLGEAPSGGGQRLWRCEIADFERFLRDQSAWYDWHRIEHEPWRGIAKAAHQRDPWLTTRQAAGLAGCSKDWVQQQIRRGNLAATQVIGLGGHWVYRIRQSAAQHWIETWQERRRSA